MKQEDKDLIFRDLCARIPYKTMVRTIDYDGSLENIWELLYFNQRTEDVYLLHAFEKATKLQSIEEVKPYLLPMSSMTDEQKEVYCELQQKVIYNSKGIVTEDVMNYVNWCYENHLDVNELIPKGFAIDATNLNIY